MKCNHIVIIEKRGIIFIDSLMPKSFENILNFDLGQSNLLIIGL